MDFEKMSLDELKDYAKSIGITVGNIGRDKLISKIVEKEKQDEEGKTVNTVLSEIEDLTGTNDNGAVENNGNSESLVESISNAIDDLDEADKNNNDDIRDLSPNTMVRVKSITFGGLTYKSRINNAIHRWNQIGSEERMSIADLIEMNNYKRDFLSKPLVILLDPKAMKYFRLTKVYENVAKVNELQRLFNSKNMNLIESTIDTAVEVHMRDVVISKSSQLIKDKILVDINIINMLSKKLNYDFLNILEQIN